MQEKEREKGGKKSNQKHKKASGITNKNQVFHLGKGRGWTKREPRKSKKK